MMQTVPVVLQQTMQDQGNHARCQRRHWYLAFGFWHVTRITKRTVPTATEQKTQTCVIIHLEVVLLVDIHEGLGSVDILAAIKGPALPLLILSQL